MFIITVYYFKNLKAVIPISLEQWQRQKWNFSYLTPLVSNMDSSMGTLMHKLLFESAVKTDKNDSYRSNMEPWDESLHLRRWRAQACLASEPSRHNTNTSYESCKWGTTRKLNISNGNEAVCIFTSRPESLEFIFKISVTCISPSSFLVFVSCVYLL